MGYNGMGYQRWIATLKPRKFLAKRSKPDGGGMNNISGRDINDYYHLKPNKLENLIKKKFSPAYRKQLESKINEESQKQIILNIFSLTTAIILVIAFLIFLMSKFDLF